MVDFERVIRDAKDAQKKEPVHQKESPVSNPARSSISIPMSQNQEFQVILLAGGTGSRMYPLTEDTPKYLLPIANRPLLSFQLELLEKVGFKDVIVITEHDMAVPLKKYVTELHKSKISVTFEVFKGEIGTAEALLRVKDKIKNDFIVISGDLIVEESFIHHMADIHRTKDAAATVLLKKSPLPPPEEIKKMAKMNNVSPDYIGICEPSKRVVMFAAAADLEDGVTIKKSVLRSYPNMTIHSDLMDAHFYIFSRWVLGALEKYQKRISSIKGEFLPFLVKLQKRKKLKKGGMPTENPNKLIYQLSSSSKGEKDLLGIFAFVMEEGVCTRVNTIQSYLEANREISKGSSQYIPWETPGKNNYIHATAEVHPKTQIGPECVVGAGTVIGAKSSVKKSNIGKHCKIGDGVKIVNSVIMDHVTISNNCSIQNSILCNSVFMGEQCSAKDSHVGVSYSFAPKASLKNESLVAEED